MNTEGKHYLDDLIELGVQLVQEVDHLERRGLGAHGGEAHDVREVDGAGLEGLGLHADALCQLPGHALGQHPVEELLGALLLLAQLPRALHHDVLQVVAVLLQHLHHLVHDAVLHTRPHRFGSVPGK